MDNMLLRINELYPKSSFVQIRKYDAKFWANREYSSVVENKAPMTQWRTNPLNFDQACRYAADGYRIGWVVPEGYVVVDIDNEDCEQSSAKVMEILNALGVKYNYNKTSRGVHLLFKDSSMSIPADATMKCALGVTVDHRANAKGYIILPTNDPHREACRWEDDIDEIPSYLKPLMIAKNQIETFIGMGPGDGRNNELFKWRSKLLQSNRLTDEEIRQALELINDYLFSEPMPASEMEASVLKSRKTDVEQREKGERTRLNVLERENIYNTIANRIVHEYDLLCVGYKRFYCYNKTHYEPMREIDLERLIHYNISENIPAQGRKEIMQFLAVKTLVDPSEIDQQWNKIAVKNGILDCVTGELSEPVKSEKNTIALPWDYSDDPEYSPKIDEFMTHLSANADGSVNLMKMQFLYQVAGYCLLKKNYFQKFFIFQGEGQTGKSTFQDLIVKMVGDNNRSRVGIDKMDNDYYLATILGKLVNIDDDAVDGKTLEQTGRFKSLISGNEVTVRQIFQEPVTFTSFATFLFSCNKLPRIMDKTSGLYRRMVIVELNNKVTNPDPLFIKKLTERDMKYFLYKAVYWIGVALQEGTFRISQSEQDLLRKFKCRQSSLNEWLYEDHVTLADIYKKSVRSLYTLYIDWAQQNGYSKLPSMFTFKEDISALYNVSVGYLPDSAHRAVDQIFTRDVEPTAQELRGVPF